jgi:UDP-GlcNAc:undecaprenyl-phosphate GlcNAc-1-phosphate transferase
LLTGRPVSQGGRDHTSHRLITLGISEGWALTLLLGISALSGLVAVLSYWYGFAYSIVLLALLVVGLALLGVHLSRAQVVAAQISRPGAPAMRLLADFPYKRQVATLVIDVVLIVVAYYTAYLLRFEADFATGRAMFFRSVGPVLGFQVLALAASGNYRGLWRYTGLSDLLHLLRAVTLGVGASVLYVVLTTRFEAFSRAVFVLDWLLLVVLLGGSRVGFRLLGERLRPRSVGLRRALIYGAGDGGALTLRELRNNAALRREVVGFLDDDQGKRGTRIHGLPVLGGLEMAEEVLAAQAVGEVIVASEKIPPERVRRLEAMCTARGIAVTRATLRIE